MTRNCKYCGEPVEEGIIYCPKCGNQMHEDDMTHIDNNSEPATSESSGATTQPMPIKGKTNWWLTSIITLLIAAALGAGGGYLYVTNGSSKGEADAMEEAPELPTIIVDEERESEASDSAMTTFDYGKWNDLNEFFDAETIGMLDRGKYTVNTVELCRNAHSWRKATIGKNEKTAIVFAHPSLRIRNYPASDSRSTVLNGLGYGCKVRIVEVVDGDWAKVEYISGELDDMSAATSSAGLTGYVSTSFLINEKLFRIMDRHITASDDDRAEFDVSKWRRATTYLIYALGATATSPKIDVEVEEVWTYEDDNTGEELESLVIFGLERKDCDVELLAFVEFFAEDEEYRILGIVPGSSILNVKMLGSGNYDIIYTTE